LNELALFAGAGGGLLASRLLGWQTVCAVELEPYCREVVLRRQRDGLLDLFPIWDDVRTFDGRPWRGVVDIVSAGFPCQPFSVAGQRHGKNDERNLWPDTARLLGEVGCRYTILEAEKIQKIGLKGVVPYLRSVIIGSELAGVASGH
jgi:DNA (cytosine-5)-methyltransferase 1